VVAVTHDDDHYDVADRVLKMQFGKFVGVIR
jgi:ABC-type siderophore export system fused ATPase/permease subunit